MLGNIASGGAQGGASFAFYIINSGIALTGVSAELQHAANPRHKFVTKLSQRQSAGYSYFHRHKRSHGACSIYVTVGAHVSWK